MPDVLRYAAFASAPSGGNPAGVVLDADPLSAETMQRIATEVGYSETAFVGIAGSSHHHPVRYFSPVAEVPFCGHATIAAAVALAERDGPAHLVFETAAGEVVVESARHRDGVTATLTSVTPSSRPVAPETLDQVLAALHWRADELDPTIPPRSAFAGAHHLVLAAATRRRLANLDYDFQGMVTLMSGAGWTTVHLVWRESRLVHHARDPFAVGGIVEDPATGAAAAAYGAYLRELGLATPGEHLSIHQGDDMGRPSLLRVEITPPPAGVRVSGIAVPIEDEGAGGAAQR